MARAKIYNIRGIVNAQNKVNDVYNFNKDKKGGQYNYVYSVRKKDGTYSIFLDSNKNKNATYTKSIGG